MINDKETYKMTFRGQNKSGKINKGLVKTQRRGN